MEPGGMHKMNQHESEIFKHLGRLRAQWTMRWYPTNSIILLRKGRQRFELQLSKRGTATVVYRNQAAKSGVSLCCKIPSIHEASTDAGTHGQSHAQRAIT
jgi:hypothetical protein